jgi:hypothetical protein
MKRICLFIVASISQSLAAEAQGTVEGILLGYAGGNRIGIYRLLSGDKVLLIQRTGDTRYHESFMGYRGYVGSRLQMRISPFMDRAMDEDPVLHADYVRMLNPPLGEWKAVWERVGQLIKLLFSKSDLAPESTRGLDYESLRALQKARAHLTRYPEFLGVEEWSIAEMRGGRVDIVMSCWGDMILRVGMIIFNAEAQIISVRIGGKDDYGDLFYVAQP